MTTPTTAFRNVTPCSLLANYRRSSKMLLKLYQTTRHHTILDTVSKTDSLISFKMPCLNLIGCRMECMSFKAIGDIGMNDDLMNTQKQRFLVS